MYWGSPDRGSPFFLESPRIVLYSSDKEAACCKMGLSGSGQDRSDGA